MNYFLFVYTKCVFVGLIFYAYKKTTIKVVLNFFKCSIRNCSEGQRQFVKLSNYLYYLVLCNQLQHSSYR